MKNFYITTEDLAFINQQVSIPVIRVVRYLTDGTAIYGYTNPNTAAVVELGVLGSFNLMTSSWAAFIPNTAQITNSNTSPFGIRDVSGLFNNLTLPYAADWGATNYAFSRNSNSDYSHYVRQIATDLSYNSRTKSDVNTQNQIDTITLSNTKWGDLTLTQKALVQDSNWGVVPGTDGSIDLTARYANPFLTVYDYTPRMVSQTVHSQVALERMDAASGGKVITDYAHYEITNLTTGQKTSVDENFVRNLNTLKGDPSLTGWSTLFGQFFDHGLDFIGKGGNKTNGVASKIYIPLDSNDPLYSANQGYLSLSRATVANPQAAGKDGMFRTADDIQSPGSDKTYGTADDVTGPTNPEYANHTSPYIDQSQTYGSCDTLTNMLREWVKDPGTGNYLPGMRLFDGTTLATTYDRQNPDGSVTKTNQTLPTLNELRNYIVSTGRDDISWADISNLRVRDAQGKVLDLDPLTGGIQEAFTDHILIADMLPRLDTSHLLNDPLLGLAGHVDPLANIRGVSRGNISLTDAPAGSYIDDYVNLTTGTPTALGQTSPAILGEIMLRAIGDHYIAGDGRINENFGLTAVHHVWHENHNWQIDNLIKSISDAQAADPTHSVALAWQDKTAFKDVNGNYTIGSATGPIAWNQEKMFQAAVLINQTEYQHVAIDQYARGLTPNIPLFFMYDSSVNADVSLEYSQAAFRFGHSQLRETIDALDPSRKLTDAVIHYALEQAFLNPAGFAKVGPTAIALGMTRQVASELDEIVTPSLQQKLLGQPQDLAAINIARGRDLGIPTLNELRKALSGGIATSLQDLQNKLIANPNDALLQQTIDKTIVLKSGLTPYISWLDFGSALTHPEALTNFLAAYTFDGNVKVAQAIVDLSNKVITFSQLDEATKSSVQMALGGTLSDSNAQTSAKAFLGTNGDQHFQNIDAWSGGLAEKHVFLGQMGPTFDAIFCDQMTRLINGDRFYYFWRLQDGLISQTHLISSIVTEQFSDIIERTTGAHHLPGNVMYMADSFVELGDQYPTGPGVYSTVSTDTTGSGQIVTINGISYIQDFRPDSSTLNPDGTPSSGFNSHEVIGGTDRTDYINAGDGDDTLYLGAGDDIGIGGAGADHIYGEAGNDYLDGGDLPDFIDGGPGDDTIIGGLDLDVLIGGDGNDKIFGGTNIDQINGDEGDDYIDGGSEGDFLFGGLGSEVMLGGEGVDIVDGELGDDVLFGGAGPDQLFGRGGDDILHGGIGAGANTVNVDECLGDMGFDIVSFSEITIAMDAVADMNFQNVNQFGGTALATPFGQLWVMIEGVEGGALADQIIGDAGNNWLIGGGNNDIISGGAGDDLIVGDSVRLDALIGKLTNGALSSNGLLDLVAAGGGKHFVDLLRANPDFTFGNNATEDPTGLIYSPSTNGTADFVTYAGALSNFRIYPVFDSIANPQTMIGLRIVDTRGIETTSIGDLVIGVEKFVFGFDFETTVAGPNAGAALHKYIDSATFTSPFYTVVDFNRLGLDPLQSTPYLLTGYAAENSTKPLASSIGLGPTNPAANILTCDLSSVFTKFGITNYNYQWQILGPTGWTDILGATGTSLSFAAGAYPQGSQFRQMVTYTEWGSGVSHTAYTPASAPMGKQIIGTSNADNLKGTAYQDVIYGSASNDNLTGNAGDDYLNGGDGNDILDGGTGADKMIGSGGNDSYTVDNPLDEVIEIAGGGTDSVQSSINYTLPTDVENLILIGTAGISGIGNNLANLLLGNSGANNLSGNAGDDTLDGGAGADVMSGGTGNDIYIVDDPFDTTIENPNEGADTVQASISWTLAATSNIENLTLTGAGNIDGTGNVLDNVLTGNGGANRLYGGLGNDTLNGAAGADTMFGGAGDDIYYVDNTSDMTVENPGEGIDTVQSSISWALASNLENLTLTGTGKINATGNDVGNVIRGNGSSNSIIGLAGNDTLYGGDGSDTLDGGAGTDILNGGAGGDIFYFSRTSDIGLGAFSDQIVDFVTGVDKIDLSAIDANINVLRDQAFTFIGFSSFSNVAGQLRFASGVLSGDTDGNGAADFEILISGVSALNIKTDIVL